MESKKRVIEVDLANERVVLATMIHDANLRKTLVRDLDPDVFGDPKHNVLFRALSLLSRRGLTYSEDTIAEIAKGSDFGGFTYLRALTTDFESTPNLQFHIERLRVDACKLKILQNELPAIVEACEDPTASPDKIDRVLVAARNRITRIGQNEISGGKKLVEGYYATLRMRKLVGAVVDGFGLPILDSVFIRGFAPGGLSIIAARPAHGKTTLLSKLIIHRVRTGKGTHVCGWEMERDDYFDMIVSSQTGIPSALLSNAIESLSDEQYESIVRVTEELGDEDLLTIEENPFVKLERPKDRWADLNERNMDHFEAMVERVSRTKTLIAVDVVGKIFHDRRPEKIAEGLIRIGYMAKRYQVHMLLLHHLNREGASDRPTLEGLKGAGAFEEEADNVFALDRPIKRVSPGRRRKMVDVIDVHLLKQRKGPAPICVRYRFNGACFALTDEQDIDISVLEGEVEDEGERT